MTVRVGLADIGPGQPVYVIAEIGSNHDDDLEQAKLLIRIAADCGANAAKFQLYRADELYPGHTTPHAVPDEWLPVLKQEAHEHGLEFLCSVFSRETLNAYMVIEPAAVKIASPEATNRTLLRAAAETGLPVIVATGATTIGQVEQARAIVGSNLILLHCVSAYPAPASEMNLNVIREMQERCRVPVGLSDHTLERVVSELAVAAGASVIEKHLTLDRTLPGPDHGFSLEPRDFKAMVRSVRFVEAVMGDGVKRPKPSEDVTDRRQAA